LNKADIVKMNKAEMKQILEFIGEEYRSEEESVSFIQKNLRLMKLF
jgi:fructokinase